MTLSAGRRYSRREFELQERYTTTTGEAFLTGVQAVCRVPLDVRRLDHRRGLNTRAFVSGYQGSPLGTMDTAFRPMRTMLDEFGVMVQPGMNELLAATAVQGTQAVPALGSQYDGVTGYWYGKAPGVDQALDGIRHGNLMGTHPSGGVLAFFGDDATAKSSTVPCESEKVMRAALVPVLAASDSDDVIRLGLHGVAMSRATGLWSSLKMATNVADGSSIVTLDLDGFDPILPLVDDKPYRHQVTNQLAAARAVGMEQNLHEVRLPLVVSYAKQNRLNEITRRSASDKIGIVAAGQSYLEVCQALADMGLDREPAGIRLLKVGMIWPLEPEIIREFADGLDEIMVVEEKGPFLETMVKEALFALTRHPQVFGYLDADGKRLFPTFGGIDADTITLAIAPRVLARGEVESVRARLEELTAPRRIPLTLTVAQRTPYFCSGCPHNTSTKAPEGSLMGGGIGCHGMAIFMDDDQVGNVTGLTQMGGEGAQWIGQAPFAEATHIFQNLGDGTLSHSGLMAIRASIAAGVNITYKILYNSTVAMTGGQDPVGEYTTPQLAQTLAAEGVKRIVITTDDTKKYRGVKLPTNTTVRDRGEIITVQEELRELTGTTVLLHDQACAAELRRKRKRGKAPDPPMRAVINARLCEGCGDCGTKSNCLSVMPVETPFGRKTEIHQSSCNKDYSCLQGDCPSFVEVIPDPGHTKTRGRQHAAAPSTSPSTSSGGPSGHRIEAGELPDPTPLFDPDGFSMRITGIGGTGVVTIAQVLATAGFVDGLFPRELDMVGLSQKAGPVVSDVKFSAGSRELSNKVGKASCDLFLACDMMVAADPGNLNVASPERTVAIANTADTPSGDMIRNPATAFPDRRLMTGGIDSRTRSGHNQYLDARTAAETLFGGDQYANMMLVGAAFQAGALPLTEVAMERAIELNGVAVETNLQAFRRGRQAVADPEGLQRDMADQQVELADRADPSPTGMAAQLIDAVGPVPGSPLAESLTLRVPDLIDYQDEAYATRYAEAVARVRVAETRVVGAGRGLTEAVAFNLYKLMAYKDEYETARLALDEAERAKLTTAFGPRAKVVWKLHPPMLRALGLKRKLSLGGWFTVVFMLLRWAKWARGSKLDIFGYAKVRRIERRLVSDYFALVDELIAELGPDNHQLAVEIASLPDEMVRGYEHIKLDNVAKYEAKLAEMRHQLAKA